MYVVVKMVNKEKLGVLNKTIQFIYSYQYVNNM